MINKILVAAGPLDASMSYEYNYFIRPLGKMGLTVIPFDFVTCIKEMGREGMNRHLLEQVKKERPDVAFFVPHTDQFIPEVIDEVNRHTLSLCYFFDDMWRIEYSRFWARHFSWVTTSDVNGVDKFKEAGINNVIYSPFACNPEVCSQKDLPKLYDVSFVGLYHPQREWYINRLRKAGIDVRVWGMGWPGGTLKHAEMVNLFNQSRINLNLSNCVSWDCRCLFSIARSLKNIYRTWRELLFALRRKDMKTVEQVKGRHFEINSCGAFQLSYYVEGLERLYAIGDEIAIFVSPEDLIEKVRYYLKHEERRNKIAQQGRIRTLRDHTMERRFRVMFDRILSV